MINHCFKITRNLLQFSNGGELGETLANFGTNSFKYNILIKHKIMFVRRFPKLIGEGYILQELNDIDENFFARYPKHIFNNWDYDVSRFIGFNTSKLIKLIKFL